MTDVTSSQASVSPVPDGPRGLGGWLILPIIGLFIFIGVTLVNILLGAREFTSVGWAVAYAELPGLTIMGVLSIVGGVAMIVLAVVCLVLIFHRHVAAPRLMVWYFILAAIIGTAEAGCLYYFAETMNDPSFIEDEPRDTIRAWIACAIWVPYFLMSKRVKNTFVEQG